MDTKNNTGDHNTGCCNTGDGNSGDGNTGDGNSGDGNSGDYNTGYCNSGDYNTGYCNSGYSNSGYFNTNEPKMRLFNKESDFTYTELYKQDKFPDFYEFYLAKWISEEEMSEQEKQEHDYYSTIGGYLKKYEYKQAWANFWKETSEENRQKFLNLPNFNADIFKDITGIDISMIVPTNCENTLNIIELNGKKYKQLKE